MLLCLGNCFPPKRTLCLCMKDGSPASTCSSSPKLDWMIKRGMVGLCPTCVLVSHWVTFHYPLFSWFCREVAVYFCCVLDCFCWDFFFSFLGGLMVCMHLYVVETISCFFVYFCAYTRRTWQCCGCTVLICYIVAVFVMLCSPTFFLCRFGSSVTSS